MRGFFPTPTYGIEINNEANNKNKFKRLKMRIPDKQEVFLVSMPDQSMAPLIVEKAEVVINTDDEIIHGDIVCIQENRTSYPNIRKIEDIGNKTILRPINPDYSIDIIDEDSNITIIGKVISFTVNL